MMGVRTENQIVTLPTLREIVSRVINDMVRANRSRGSPQGLAWGNGTARVTAPSKGRHPMDARQGGDIGPWQR